MAKCFLRLRYHPAWTQYLRRLLALGGDQCRGPETWNNIPATGQVFWVCNCSHVIFLSLSMGSSENSQNYPFGWFGSSLRAQIEYCWKSNQIQICFAHNEVTSRGKFPTWLNTLHSPLASKAAPLLLPVVFLHDTASCTAFLHWRSSGKKTIN